ncbi:hypothetical protein MGSAQ_000611 [marine sediment metagenome]|uniref:Uncharacterized protein n=1 Tax=marine sediment metagenome TaxID=412755 RepID=A0A1B6NWQ8_9ZZZZ
MSLRKRSRLSTRRSGGLPAMTAATIAPIEAPEMRVTFSAAS